MKPVFLEHRASEFLLGRKTCFDGNYLDKSLKFEDKMLKGVQARTREEFLINIFLLLILFQELF